jgi:hypothetical protein
MSPDKGVLTQFEGDRPYAIRGISSEERPPEETQLAHWAAACSTVCDRGCSTWTPLQPIVRSIKKTKCLPTASRALRRLADTNELIQLDP